MVIDPTIMAILTGAGSVIATLSGLVYRELRQQIADKNARIATLETEAREAMRAKDAEILEWRKRALDPTQP